jgi:hypothetical protein
LYLKKEVVKPEATSATYITVTSNE